MLRFLAALLLISAVARPLRAEDPTPIPELRQWEKNMVEFGAKFVDQRKLGIFPEVNIWFYDGEWVYFQIYDYTKDSKWLVAAQNCEETYRTHVFELRGKLPGHRMHPHGLYEDYRRNKDEKSKEALLLLARNANWVVNCKGGVKSFGCGRENGYTLMTLLLAEELGDNQPQMIENSVEAGLFCLDEFSVTKKAEYAHVFFGGIQSEALIMYAEKKNRVDRVLPCLIRYADWLWDHCWVEEDQALCYHRDRPEDPRTKPKKGDGAAILNQLTSPLYAWLYRQTGEARFRDRGDKMFAGGVKNGWLDQGKAFSQNYRWSFSYVKWRREGPLRKASASSGAEFTAGAGAKKKSEKPETTTPASTNGSEAGTPAAISTSAHPPGEAVKPEPVAALDPAVQRAALEEFLKKNGKAEKGEKVLIQSLKQEVELAAFSDKALTIVIQGNQLPLRWKDVSSEDLIRIATVCCDDAEGLYLGGALAAAMKMTTVRDKFLDRLGELDPKKAGDLFKLR